MTTCGICQTENSDGSQYCDECGAALAPPPVHTSIRPVDTVAEKSNALAAGAPPSDEQSAGQPAGVAEVAVRQARTVVAPAQTTRSFTHASVQSSESALAQNSHAKLVIQRGRSSGKEFLLNENETLIGRWDADGGIFPDVDLDTDDPEAKVSRRHARILRRGDHYFIEDLGSTNGTFVNRGRRLLPGDLQPLREADEIIVGKTFLRLYLVK